MTARGIPNKKTWLYATDESKPLIIPKSTNPQPLKGGGKWNYHVAPVADVLAPDGSVEKMVFDPSLFDHPVSIAEWQNKMNGNGTAANRVERITGNDVFFIDHKGKYVEPGPNKEEVASAFESHFKEIENGYQ